MACLATTSECEPLDQEYIINNLGDIGCVEGFGRSETTLISMLHELGVKIGFARNKSYCRRIAGSDNTELTPLVAYR